MSYIYESLDGGHAVYARSVGQAAKEKIHESDQALEIRQQLAEAELWSNIREAALTNPSIANALNQAKILYLLSKND
jgi:hypothetical protein